MYYEINVAKKNPVTGRYEHLFATAERSITSRYQLRKVYEEISSRFTGDEYNITVEYWEKTGRTVDMKTLEK